MNKKFVTLFYPTTNVHLIKDVGMIPYYMHKVNGYESSIVCYKNTPEIYNLIGYQDYVSILDDSYSYLNTAVRGLKVDFIPYTGKLFFFQKSVAYYLLKNSKSIDVLNLYHFTPESFLFGLIYKFKNRKGKLFLKMDAGASGLNTLKIKSNNYVIYFIKNTLLIILKYFFIQKLDIISNETRKGMELVGDIDSRLPKKTIYLPNGIDDLFLKSNMINRLEYKEKENIIVSVGRLGNYAKNTELLLDVLTRVNLKEWKVYLVGHIEEHFKQYIESFFDSNPQLKNKIIFTGNIVDRKELFELYNQCKIFLGTSRSESFFIALVEAMYFGNYIVSTEVGAIHDITKGGSLGSIIKNHNSVQLSNKLNSLINNTKILSDTFQQRIDWSENFLWSKIILRLQTAISENQSSIKSRNIEN